MAKEIIKLSREDDSGGGVVIYIELNGNRYQLENFPSHDAMISMSREWVNDHLQAAGRLALLAYLAVDPAGNNNALLQDVVTEVDTESLIIVRRTVTV